MTPPPGASRLGTRFGPYELKSLIGVGGMGEVYRAYDTVKERMVAVKLLRTEIAADASYQERFRRESRVAARLQEPHVIPVHDFGEIDGVLYIDMRLVEGASVKDLLRSNGPLTPARATAIITQVASALDAAHADGLVHRDIKPENVLLTSDDFAYLVDFGIAHIGGEASVTMTGVLIGSSAYMAPERFSGGPVGPAADVYALTCLLYEMLIGRPPFETGDLRQLMSAHMFSPAPRPSIMRRGIPRGFDDVVAKGMAKDAVDRYPSAGELAKAARDAASSAAGTASAPPPLPPAPAPAPVAPPRLTPPPQPQPSRLAPASSRRSIQTRTTPASRRTHPRRRLSSRRGPSRASHVQPYPAHLDPGDGGVVRHRRCAGRDAGQRRRRGLHPRDADRPDPAQRGVRSADHHHDHDLRVGDGRRQRHRRAGLRRPHRAVPRGQHPGRGDPHRVVAGGDLPDRPGQLLLPR
ncbi:serine/threonine protein kinase [Mycolicibacterium farcinogenes]|uniref:serine/threonine-protein kinase n=1 Tax=Mycolicibacterium farcinogenes TaxID=1802 RepID=UPI000457CDF3|nr:serine/threonine protein kinase [Mycolicibacterium farcinogenes]